MTVMKIYRRSIKKSTSMYTLKPIVVILALFLLMTIGNLKGFLVFLVIELCVLSFIVACTATQLFYVVLTENSLIVQNPAYRFWYAEFQFNTIEKIEIGYKGGLSRPYIQVMTPAKKSWRYVTDLIILLAASASALFYIELTENELILKNAACRFWHKAYPYQTITRINTVRFSFSHSSRLRTERRMISDGGRCRCEGAAPGSRTARMSSFTASVPISSVGWPMQVIAGSR